MPSFEEVFPTQCLKPGFGATKKRLGRPCFAPRKKSARMPPRRFQVVRSRPMGQPGCVRSGQFDTMKTADIAGQVACLTQFVCRRLVKNPASLPERLLGTSTGWWWEPCADTFGKQGRTLIWVSAPRSLFERSFFVQLALAWSSLWVVPCPSRISRMSKKKRRVDDHPPQRFWRTRPAYFTNGLPASFLKPSTNLAMASFGPVSLMKTLESSVGTMAVMRV